MIVCKYIDNSFLMYKLQLNIKFNIDRLNWIAKYLELSSLFIMFYKVI